MEEGREGGRKEGEEEEELCFVFGGIRDRYISRVLIVCFSASSDKREPNGV